jgi:hypothetical protein
LISATGNLLALRDGLELNTHLACKCLNVHGRLNRLCLKHKVRRLQFDDFYARQQFTNKLRSLARNHSILRRAQVKKRGLEY